MVLRARRIDVASLGRGFDSLNMIACTSGVQAVDTNQIGALNIDVEIRKVAARAASEQTVRWI